MRWWDKSWNPCFGCTPCSEGCDHCVIFDTLAKQKRDMKPGYSEFVAKNRLYANMNYQVCSMGDLFHIDYTYRQIDQVFDNMLRYPKNRYFVLTKRSKEMRDYFSDENFPKSLKSRLTGWNPLWMGVTVENSKCLFRIDDLLNTPVIKHRFIALEPLLEKISVKPYLESGLIEWVIIGSETGDGHRHTENEWIESLINECRSYNVPVYITQIDLKGYSIRNMDLFPEELQFRETPWKIVSSEFDGYNTSFTMDRRSVIGLKTRPDEYDFKIKTPKFVYDALKSRCLEPEVGNSELMNPIEFLPAKGSEPVRKKIQNVREFLLNQYVQVKNMQAPEKWVEMLLPSDVFVKFHWNIPKDKFADLQFNRTIPELKQMLTSMKVLAEKNGRSANVVSQ